MCEAKQKAVSGASEETDCSHGCPKCANMSRVVKCPNSIILKQPSYVIVQFIYQTTNLHVCVFGIREMVKLLLRNSLLKLLCS